MNADPDLIHQFKGLKGVVLDIDFTSKTNQVAASTTDNSIYVWSLENPKNIRSYK